MSLLPAMHTLTRRRLLAALALGAGVAMPARADGPLHGRMPPAGLGGAVDLVDQRGQRFTWSRVSGQPVLLTFGFTRCSASCPPALGVARQVLQGLRPNEPTAVVFVTLDPLSDSPDALRQYLGAIDARIVGLTGEPVKVAQAADHYGVGVRLNQGTLEHSSMWYLLDGRAQLRRVYGPTTPAEHLLADIRRLQAAAG